MESHGEHTRSKPLMIFWMVIGLGIGVIIGTSTTEWGLGLSSGILMGALLAWFATKPGVVQ